jgi:transposase InsO family protein
LIWWKENGAYYPLLQRIARKYLCVPATSVPSERLFSKVGELVSKKRNRIKPKNIDVMLF